MPAGADGFPAVGLAVSLVDGPAGVRADALVGGFTERLPDGPAAASPSDDELHPAMATNPATIHPTAHHRIPAPPNPLPQTQHARSRRRGSPIGEQ
ncbi:hypothetical protein GCM10022207_51760 [Streptomyces lannensis]|uniref:Uncharacterized protein n=1 Tax=Streptomyces lannensis TaxID=766498 RepID=A0ABP7KIF5_9ACTN